MSALAIPLRAGMSPWAERAAREGAASMVCAVSVGGRTTEAANPVSSGIHGKSRMRTYGSVRGAISDGHPYRDS